MKTSIKLFIIVALISLAVGCNKTNDFVSDDSIELKSAKIQTVTVPFKANFTVKDYSDYTDGSCGPAPIYSLTMKGEGNINHMGSITTEMTFCCNTSNGFYWDTNCTFVAANGDELYATIPTGQILPNEGDNSDYYQTYFNDKMYFVGGTGRFEGASGEAMSNAYVHNDPENWHTDFFSNGELILVKGKK